jgi:O-antigen/teichoic acid export membrane protein
MSFKKQSLYLFLDTGLGKFLNIIGFIILTNILTSIDIGIIGITLSYAVILNYLSIRPENILLKKKKYNENKEVSSFIYFWLIRSSFVLLFVMAITIILWFIRKDFILCLFFLIYGVVVNITYFTELFMFLFFIKKKQNIVFYSNIIFNTFRIILILLLIYSKSVILYGFFLLFIELIKSTFFFIFYKYKFKLIINFKKIKKILKDNILSFSLWHHLNGITISWIFYIDTIILSFFIAMEIIGDYTVAMKIAFILFQFVLVFEKLFCIMLKKSKNYLKLFVKLLLGLNILAIFCFWFFGEWLLTYVFKVSNISLVFNIGLILLFSIIPLVLSWPYFCLILCNKSLKDFFVQITIPFSILTLIVFGLFTLLFGVYGTAWANVVSYLLFFIGVMWFLRK